ncbi:Werner syndrome ATP-dependent helicase -like protein [Babesia sp. Xinjiang]|uniref:Werner syndrome ATP-dependent helicase -like protein n=1 Tax=Babesia sp. Xinjiang TaxID=462227 RepID=UPI000A24DB0F|nr:Werner syndrome ATP-dependent helicase -like protein [Babesia sp. Xinjiang]ORM41799.1 Werner syndrome ATP-dependent helicase -like protein [Babesia sp. Xinjiang]
MLFRLITLALCVLRCRSYRIAVGAGKNLRISFYRGLSAVPGLFGTTEKLSCNVSASELKPAEFKGRIVIIDDGNADKYVESPAELLSTRCVGFDLEYVPDYYSSVHRHTAERTRPAVVQIAGRDVCLVYLIYKIGHLPEPVSSLLRDPNVLKVAHGAPSDMRLLFRHFGVCSRNFVDLQNVCEEMHIRPCSLKGVAEQVLGLKLSKTQQCSNWEASALSEAQIRYAATDAWVTLEAFLKLKPPSFRKLIVNETGDVKIDNVKADGSESTGNS